MSELTQAEQNRLRFEISAHMRCSKSRKLFPQHVGTVLPIPGIDTPAIEKAVEELGVAEGIPEIATSEEVEKEVKKPTKKKAKK